MSVGKTLKYSPFTIYFQSLHPQPFNVFFEGFRGGASHPVPGSRWGHCCHQGHLYSPQDPQVSNHCRVTIRITSLLTGCDHYLTDFSYTPLSATHICDGMDFFRLIQLFIPDLRSASGSSISSLWLSQSIRKSLFALDISYRTGDWQNSKTYKNKRSYLKVCPHKNYKRSQYRKDQFYPQVQHCTL